MTSDYEYHVPVMLSEVIDVLSPSTGGLFIDATLGAGGHAAAVAGRIGPDGILFGLDQDPDALAEASDNLSGFGNRIRIVRCRFDNLKDALNSNNTQKVNGVLFDLGVSSHQLDAAERGFSFKDPDALLDMRMDQTAPGLNAADILNTSDLKTLTTLIRDNSDERWAARIAQVVVDRRKNYPFRTVGQLIEAVHAAIPVAARPPDKHAATRTFQSLRIAVNQELEILESALRSAIDVLESSGVCVVLTYHSLEDRIVKNVFSELAGRGEGVGPYGERPKAIVELINRKPMLPTAAEVQLNPRARSAKLRAVRKV